MENGESERGIKHDSGKTGHHTRVETHGASCRHDFCVALGNTEVTATLLLHLGLDHIDGVVEHHTAEPCKASSNKVDGDLVVKEGGKPLFGVSEDNETHSLVRRLLEHSGDNTLVETVEALLASNCFNT